MEFEISKLRLEFLILRSKLVEVVDEKGRVESVVELKEKELCVLMKIMLQNSEVVFSFDFGLDMFSYYEVQQKVFILLQKDFNDVKYVFVNQFIFIYCILIIFILINLFFLIQELLVMRCLY